MDFLKWYKNKVESNDQEPPEIIWENIQDDFDIEQSWHFINNHLNRQTSIKRQYFFSAVAGILILIMAGGYWLYNPRLKKQEFKQITETVISAEKNVLENTLSTNEIKIAKENKVKNIKEVNVEKQNPFLSENNTDEQNIYEKELVITTETSRIKDIFIVRLDVKDILFISSLEQEFIIADIKKTESLQNEKKERTAFRKLYLGSTGQLANTWLLNDKTFSGLESSNLTASNASFGSNFGIFIGTNITEQVDLQLNINILVQNNQNYNEYINGHYVSDNMQLNYSQAALSLRYYFISKRFMQGEHGINLGGYLGCLHNAYQIIDKETTNITGNYNALDYGVFLGYEYIIPVYRKLSFGTGVRTDYGLQNIYTGDEYIPGYMNKTYNASLNITFSLKYRIK